MAVSTCDGCATPAEHALPVEHSMPAPSNSSSNASPSQPGNEKCAVPGRRSAGDNAPLSTASGTANWTASTSPLRSVASRDAS
jgi:hypothetical protein